MFEDWPSVGSMGIDGDALDYAPIYTFIDMLYLMSDHTQNKTVLDLM